LVELELFGHDPAPASDPQNGISPDSLTASAPTPRSDGAVAPTNIEWLQGLQLPDIPIRWDERVVRFLEFFRDDPRGRSFIRAWMVRERRYGAWIRAELRDLGVPEDLLYVAMVESGFNPTARSHAAAVGLWQFVRATGEEYGLERTHWVDQRMNAMRSTRAAGRYLRDLHERFGSWDLALAAYNMGLGALMRAMRKYNSNDYWLLSRIEAGLPFETTVYVAKIMACAIVGRNPERFGLTDLGEIEPLRLSTVRVPAGTRIQRLAATGNIEVDDLMEINAELRRRRVPPGGGPYTLYVPADRADALARAWARLRVRQENTRNYQVLFGEDLSELARRFRTSTDRLRELNEFDESATLGPGQIIVVPDVEPRQRSEEANPVAAVPEARFRYEGRRRVFYRVTRNDRIEDISRFFQVSTDELLRWNSLSATAALQSGLLLQLFVPAAVDLSQALVLNEGDVRVLVVGSEDFFAYHAAQDGRVRHRHQVAAGETIATLAERYGLRRADIARINRFSRQTRLEPGQTVIVYTTPERVPQARRAITEAESSPASANGPGESRAPEDEPPSADSRPEAATGDTSESEAEGTSSGSQTATEESNEDG